ncbi:MAG: hypothetical protein WC319_10550 [Candidatus Paceibacterota bacterium]
MKILTARSDLFETKAKYAVAIASKLLGIKKVDVEFVDSEFLKGKTITSMYLPDHNLIQNEGSETIAKWKREFKKYYRTSDEYQDDPEYLEQEIEKDAIAFSQMCLRKLG